MRVDATYDNGKIVLHRPLRFFHQRFDVKVEVPEDEIVDKEQTQAEKNATAVKTLPQVNELPEEYVIFKRLQEEAFGKDYVYSSEASDSEIIHQRWIEKHA